MITKKHSKDNRSNSKTKKPDILESKSLERLLNVTLLYTAARADKEKLRELLKEGANPNTIDHNGYTPLMIVADSILVDESQGILEAELLIDHGADVNKTTDKGVSALILAAREGKADLVKLLLENGAEVNAHTTHENKRKTALDCVSDLIDKYYTMPMEDRHRDRKKLHIYVRVVRILVAHEGKKFENLEEIHAIPKKLNEDQTTTL